MKWTQRQPPETGATRIRQRFAWLPLSADLSTGDTEWHWLEWVWVREKYTSPYWGEGYCWNIEEFIDPCKLRDHITEEK